MAVACVAAVLVPATSASAAADHRRVRRARVARRRAAGVPPTREGPGRPGRVRPRPPSPWRAGSRPSPGLAPGGSATAALAAGLGAGRRGARDAYACRRPPGASTRGGSCAGQSDGSGLPWASRARASSGTVALAITKVRKSGENDLGRVALPPGVTKGSAVSSPSAPSGTAAVALPGQGLGRRYRPSPAGSSRSRTPPPIASPSPAPSGSAVLELRRTRPLTTTTFDDLSVVQSPQAAAPVPGARPHTDPDAGPPARRRPPRRHPPPRPRPRPRSARSRVPAPVRRRTPFPPGALFVSPGGNDSAAGSQAAPFRTLGAAVAKAKAGGTVVLRAGSYNESVVVPFNKPLTIQAYPKEAVWLDGSVPVSSWQRSGSGWSTPWTSFPSSALLGIADNPRFLSPSFPLAGASRPGLPRRRAADAGHYPTSWPPAPSLRTPPVDGC